MDRGGNINNGDYMVKLIKMTLYCPKCEIKTLESGYCERCGATWRTDIIVKFSEENKERLGRQGDLFNHEG